MKLIDMYTHEVYTFVDSFLDKYNNIQFILAHDDGKLFVTSENALSRYRLYEC